ncbi:MAG: MXAN_2562 family outer membrane beta-barrel protein [Polyangiaceae bacterium]
MNRFAPVLAFSLGSLFLNRVASAQTQGTDEFGAYAGPHSGGAGESAQNGAVEVRFGRYLPQVDKAVPGAPYRDVFGTKSRYMFGLEADWQVLRFPHLGTLGAGLGWGFTSASAKARITATGELSSEDTSLSVMPFYLVGVLRADVFARDYSIPLVPYAKIGLGYALWWANDGGTTARVNGQVGRGVSYGPQYALGLMFLLDELDQQTARDADNSLGINNSYIFAEWFDSELDGFGSKNRLNVGANSWVLGLAIEF